MNTDKQVIENYAPNELILDPQLETDLPNKQLFRPQPTDIPTVINIIKNLKNTNSYGKDEILYKYIKKLLRRSDNNYFINIEFLTL